MSTKYNNVSAPEVVTSIRLSREQHEQLKELATREHRSLSQEMRRMVELHLASERKAA